MRYRAPMPRPLKLPERLVVAFPEGTISAIDWIAGPGKRAEFIRQAVAEKLERIDPKRGRKPT